MKTIALSCWIYTKMVSPYWTKNCQRWLLMPRRKHSKSHSFKYQWNVIKHTKRKTAIRIRNWWHNYQYWCRICRNISKLKQHRGFNALNDNIRSFIEYRDKIGAITTIRVKIMEFNQISDDEIEAFHDTWEGIADQVQVTGVHDWNGAINNLTVTDETSPYRYPCALLWYALAVNSNGDVSTCNVDWNYSGVVGNIHKNVSIVFGRTCLFAKYVKHI